MNPRAARGIEGSKMQTKQKIKYACGITPKRVTSGGGPISAIQRLGNTVLKKRRSGGKPI